MKKKIIAIALCAALAVGGVVAGSLAFLMDETEDVVNTFTVGDINIDLKETADGTENGEVVQSRNDFKMIPGYTLAKNPYVTVEADSEACLIFVEIKEENNFRNFMTYDVELGNNAWTKLETDADGNKMTRLVYYRTVMNGGDTKYYVLKDNQVKVLDGVTKEMMDAIDGVVDENAAEGAAEAEVAARPKLTFTAYAHQLYTDEKGTQIDPATAWKNLTTPTT